MLSDPNEEEFQSRPPLRVSYAQSNTRVPQIAYTEESAPFKAIAEFEEEEVFTVQSCVGSKLVVEKFTADRVPSVNERNTAELSAATAMDPMLSLEGT